MASTPEVLTAREAADFLRTRPETLKRLAREGKVPGAKLGHEWRFLRDDLIQFLSGGYEQGTVTEDRGQGTDRPEPTSATPRCESKGGR